ncbi:hypothetical protein I4F81_008328 [Pyropia yezoensis]|uniref:Uncharacterized protein n=1 Tax=Pyropia yezoensis TaxID=2788 RepID=A0ACC3C748_PYRYE|nr:hypothetical protein I4F81_008328 [Neopyropia yezoensis]
MRAAPAARLGPLRRPSLVAVAVLLTLTVPLAVVRLAVDGDDPGMGVRGVGDTIRQASAHMLNSWSPVSLPALPSLSALSALADRSMSAAASAGGAIVGRTTRAGAGSPRPRLALRLGDEDHPLPGTLRLLRSCEGPPAANGGGCEPDLSAHIPDMRRVHVALPLPAVPPGLLTVYPSGRPGLYDGQVGADEAAGELAATVVWRLEDDGVVVVARGCAGLSAADAGGAEAGRAFTAQHEAGVSAVAAAQAATEAGHRF